MIYYQCDTASYTADAGGLKFLEHLFEYKDGAKVFDEENYLHDWNAEDLPDGMYYYEYIGLNKEITNIITKKTDSLTK